MNATILCVGRLRETWQREGCEEYLKRLSRYGKYEIVAVDDVRDPEKPSEALIKKAMEREGQALLKHIRPEDRVVCLCIEGMSPDSVRFSEMAQAWEREGRRIVYVIGGSNGLSEAVLRRADLRLSFSRFTFPHGLMRVILLEQLYRAERIRSGEPYHK
ncbi:MAG: 23S rRNA (pseudouridine(1915)-N(3))-methyltransferase RlmH [Clostridia bacterium]|nr:23S rRNA (pseudouridine(1915)-N(3))-methyltransferase RlmH [Clostridia bacterium]